MRAHTPGPWKLFVWPENVAVLLDRSKPRDCEHVAYVYRGPEQLNNEGREVADANARLIAAAPDLFAALEGVMDLVTAHTQQQDDRVLAALRALAKARGDV